MQEPLGTMGGTVGGYNLSKKKCYTTKEQNVCPKNQLLCVHSKKMLTKKSVKKQE